LLFVISKSNTTVHIRQRTTNQECPFKKNEIQVMNESPNKIKVCAFNGNDKALLIPHSKSNIGPGKSDMSGCKPDDTDTCKVRLLKPGDKCTDSSWPVINANKRRQWLT
jgi:hypothetical protein